MAAPADLGLRDIHLPEAVGWWPPGIGWWLILFILVTAAVLAPYAWRRYRRGRWRRQALREWGRLQQQWRSRQDTAQLAAELSVLLRRVSLVCYPRDQVAGLAGQRWLALLDQPLGGNEFQRGLGRCLQNGPYEPEPGIEGDALLALARRWLKKVRPGGVQ